MPCWREECRNYIFYVIKSFLVYIGGGSEGDASLCVWFSLPRSLLSVSLHASLSISLPLPPSPFLLHSLSPLFCLSLSHSLSLSSSPSLPSSVCLYISVSLPLSLSLFNTISLPPLSFRGAFPVILVTNMLSSLEPAFSPSFSPQKPILYFTKACMLCHPKTLICFKFSLA